MSSALKQVEHYTIDEVIGRVRAALADITHRTDIQHLSEHASLTDEVGLDSMSVLSFFMALEDQFDGFRIDVDAVETSDLLSIYSVASFVHRRLG